MCVTLSHIQHIRGADSVMNHIILYKYSKVICQIYWPFCVEALLTYHVYVYWSNVDEPIKWKVCLV